MTTFASREAVRDELVTLFSAISGYKAVYGYFPGATVFSEKSPILIVRARGTRQQMKMLETNPRSYRIALTTAVLAYDANQSYDTSEAEDALDDLDRALCQKIRDSVTAGYTNMSTLEFADEYSDVQDVIIAGLPFILETRFVLAHLPGGAI